MIHKKYKIYKLLHFFKKLFVLPIYPQNMDLKRFKAYQSGTVRRSKYPIARWEGAD